MSPDLIAFLKAWHDWATNGAPDMMPFVRSDGLCYNVWQFYGARDVRSAEVRADIFRMLGGETYPFGRLEYYRRDDENSQHECPKRLAWVREKLVEAGELVA